MGLSALTFKLLFTFLPGIVTLVVIDVLTIHKKWGNLIYFLYSFVLGLLNYLIWYFVAEIPCFNIEYVNFLEDMTAISLLEVKQVIFVTILSILVGLLLAYIINYKLVFRFAKIIKVSRSIGDIDIWSFIFNSSENTEWVVVRDFDNDLMYRGWVAAFSQTDVRDKDEIFLKEVEVYVNSTAEFIYKTPGMYIASERGKLLIEFPNLNYEGQQYQDKEKNND